MNNYTLQIDEIQKLVKELERELSKLVDSFMKETGIPIAVFVGEPQTTTIGQKYPTQEIFVKVII